MDNNLILLVISFAFNFFRYEVHHAFLQIGYMNQKIMRRLAVKIRLNMFMSPYMSVLISNMNFVEQLELQLIFFHRHRVSTTFMVIVITDFYFHIYSKTNYPLFNP